jgi:hypothetical protein
MKTVALIASLQLLSAQAGRTPVVIRQVASEHGRDSAIERIVAEKTGGLDRLERVHYQYNRVDLNGDGTLEVLLRIESRATCGSGGCFLWVLQKTVAGYRKVSAISATWAPVIVSERRTRGWNDLIL